jgi:OOP family OmpA-OmpF porin
MLIPLRWTLHASALLASIPLLLLSPPHAAAQAKDAQAKDAQAKDAKGSKDHPAIKRYDGSVIIGYDFRSFDEYELLLGPVQRAPGGAANVLAPTRSERLEGRVTRILYVAPEGRSPLEVLRNYEQELQKSGFQTLYQCARKDCGSDDGWLAEYYLYSRERKLRNTPPAGSGRAPGQVSEYAFSGAKDQRFFTAKRESPEGNTYASVYAAQGQFDMHKETFNHAIVLLEVVDTVPMESNMVTVDAAAMAKGIAATGHVAVYGIYFDTDKAELKPESAPTLKEIAGLLKQDSKLTLYVVGHTDNVGVDDYNMDLSRRRAASVVSALAAQHAVDARRLKPAGVGRLAPVAANDTDEGRAKNRRVELVKQ